MLNLFFQLHSRKKLILLFCHGFSSFPPPPPLYYWASPLKLNNKKKVTHRDAYQNNFLEFAGWWWMDGRIGNKNKLALEKGIKCSARNFQNVLNVCGLWNECNCSSQHNDRSMSADFNFSSSVVHVTCDWLNVNECETHMTIKLKAFYFNTRNSAAVSCWQKRPPHSALFLPLLFLSTILAPNTGPGL